MDEGCSYCDKVSCECLDRQEISPESMRADSGCPAQNDAARFSRAGKEDMSKGDKLKWEALMSLMDKCLLAGNAAAAMVYLAAARRVGR